MILPARLTDYVFGMRDMDRIKFLKWASTAAVLSGIVLTNLNIFPLNIIVHGTGAWLDSRRLSDKGQGIADQFLSAVTNFRVRDY